MEEKQLATASSEVMDNSIKAKKPRKRMKELRKKILSQMEFYFSDSNLAKDRFLKQEMDKSGDKYVDINLFLKFNKIRQLTDDTKVITRSLKKSTLLEVNSEGTKIRRTVPLQSLPNVDDRTVYVEHLPRNIDHEWVTTLFSQCGQVLYVSLPRFRTTNDLKGFGFVEFSSKEEAMKACELLNNPPPMSARTGRFPKWNKMLCQLAKKTGQEPTEDAESQEKPKDPVEEPVQKPCKKHKKRRRRPSDSSLDGSSDPLPQKKRKTDSTDGTDENDGKEVCTDCGKDPVSKEQGKLDESLSDGLKFEDDDRKEGKKKKRGKKQKLSDTNKSFEEDSEPTDSSVVDKGERSKRKRTSDSRESGEFSAPIAKVSKPEVEEATENTVSEKKRKRKRKKKNKEKDVPPPQLKVITKNEWLRLRGEYLSMQKSSMAAMKQTLKQQEEEKKKAESNMTDQSGKKSGVAPPAIEFVQGVIVQVSCKKPMNRKSLKEKLPNDANVAYFDIKDESTDGHIRCKDEESARKISEFLLENYTFSILTGESEKQYWNKLTCDREDKFNNKKRSKKRGSQKLIEKAHRHNTEIMEKKKHIVFED